MDKQQLALVLGGGGIAGIAWETGILKGLRDAGLDLTGADLIVGTSAGSVVGAQLTTGGDIDTLYTRESRPFDPTQEHKSEAPLTRMLLAMARAWRPFETQQQWLSRLGALARKADTPSEESRLAALSLRLPVQTWPERKLYITAIDTSTGERVTWDQHSEASLLQAVSSSCAIPMLVTPTSIQGRRYMDGGMASATNAQLAEGYARVVIIAVSPSKLGPFVKEMAVLRKRGSLVTLILPDKASRKAIFPNPQDPARRQPSALAGLKQAQAEAEHIRAQMT